MLSPSSLAACAILLFLYIGTAHSEMNKPFVKPVMDNSDGRLGESFWNDSDSNGSHHSSDALSTGTATSVVKEPVNLTSQDQAVSDNGGGSLGESFWKESGSSGSKGYHYSDALSSGTATGSVMKVPVNLTREDTPFQGQVVSDKSGGSSGESFWKDTGSSDSKGSHYSDALRACRYDLKKYVKYLEIMDGLRASPPRQAPEYAPDTSARSSDYYRPAEPPTPSLGPGPSLMLLLLFVCLVIGLLVMINKAFRPPTPPATAAPTIASSALQPLPSRRAPLHGGELILLQQPGGAPTPMWRALQK